MGVATNRVVVVSGASPYADEWHDFAATSARLADVVRGLGHQVDVVEDVEGALSAPSGDLLVVNIGNPVRARPPERLHAVGEGVSRYLDKGGALLAMHVSSGSLADVPAWGAAVGGRWVWDHSWHPPIGPARITVHRDAHPAVAGLPDVEVHDERYCDLVVADDVTVLGDHEQDGRRHPMVWARSPRIAYDGLGHDVRSYDSPTHRELLARLVAWLLR